MSLHLTRREFAMATGAAMLASPALGQTSAPLARAIPSTGELLPAVGLGTAQVFNTNDEATRQKAAAVLQALIAGGGRLVDTSSVYGEAETVLGEVTTSGGLRQKLFIATKLESPDAAELKRSQARLQTMKFDLLQFHNVRDPQQSLAQFKEWKAQGVCRYIGITSTRREQYAAIEAVLLREKPDFVQIDYSLDDRECQKAHFARSGRGQERRAHRLAVRPGAAVSRRAGQGGSGLGARFRRHLGTVFPEVSSERPPGNCGYPRHRRCRAYDRQSRRHARSAARPRPAQANGGVCRCVVEPPCRINVPMASGPNPGSLRAGKGIRETQMPWLSYNSRRIHYELAGPDDGPAFVLINGLTQYVKLWIPFRDALVARGFRVVSFDMLGQGQSDKPRLFIEQVRPGRCTRRTHRRIGRRGRFSSPG